MNTSPFPLHGVSAVPYSLRFDVFWCRVGDRVVLLDLSADRYLALPLAANAAFLTLADGVSDDEDLSSALAPLIDGGLMVRAPTTQLPPAPHIVPAAYGLSGEPRVKPFLSLEAWATQALMAREMKRRPLSEIINKVRFTKRYALESGQGRSPSDLGPAVSSFCASSRLITAQEQCLRWSLSMVTYLARRGCFPSLVLGVRMMPFAAHAWVQADDVILSDTLEHVAPYTPILVI